MTSTRQTEPTPDDDQLVRYLLGELGEAETAELDEALARDAVWDAMQRAEDEVLETYAAGGLSATQRDRLRDRLAVSARLRERLALLEGLHVVAARRQRPRRRAGIFAAGSALAFAAALVVFFAVRGSGASDPDQGGEVVALALMPATRSVELPTVHIDGHPMLALSVALDAEDAYPRYRVRLVQGGTVVWSQGDAVAANGALALRVPVRLLGDGAYSIELEGIAVDGALIKLGTRGFVVER